MKKLETSHTVFDLEPPSYKEITKIINKTKSSESPCPHDQIGIIILKRCPILRTYIHKITSHCWTHRMFRRCWKYAFTILVYKKKSNTEPSTFFQLLYNQFWRKFTHLLFVTDYTTFL